MTNPEVPLIADTEASDGVVMSERLVAAICLYAWWTPNPWGGTWGHTCRLDEGHQPPHRCLQCPEEASR